MKRKNLKKNGNGIFFLLAFSFLIIILLLIYIIYLKFIPYTILEYNGYAVSGKEIATNLLSTNFDVDYSVKALQVKDQDSIYENMNSYYLGASKQNNINLNYPIYVNNSLALYNLSSKVKLITDDFQEIQGYSGTTLTSGELYNTNTLQRADYYDYILLKNSDNLYINTKELKIKTNQNEYIIKMNGIINFTKDFITYYSLNNDEFVYNKILDIDENSVVTVEDYNRIYTYKEFLMNLGIIRENTNTSNEKNEIEENEKEENTTKENNTVDIEEAPKEETEKEEIKDKEEDKKQEEDNQNENNVEIAWIKPTVTCSGFTSNVYSAFANLEVSDPSKVIYKAITFTFYKDNQIAFRVSGLGTGQISVTKLLPKTKYMIVGTYQYKNKEGNLIENTILEQEITTKSVENLNPIELKLENGQIYANKIEFKNIKIVSNIPDEAIYGVTKAEIIINGVKYSIDSNTLRKILNGEDVTYKTRDGLKSNSKCNYEIRFYDTDGNVMNLKNNTGNTVTSKSTPSVKIKVLAQDIIKVNIETTLINEDNVTLSNYRYVLYSENGEEVRKENIGKEETITFTDLDPMKTYTIKVYADFDCEDGNGMQYNQEIGNSTFSTIDLSKLGSVKLDVSYDVDNDLTYNSINLTTRINAERTDSRLIKILKNVTLAIQDENGNELKSIQMTDISQLVTEGGISSLIENLQSNNAYYIVITATAAQGNIEEEISASYTLKQFLTKKMPAKLNVANVVVTTNLIDMDIYIDDIDQSCLENIVNIRLADSYGKEYIPEIESEDIDSNTKIPTNQWVRLTYRDLTENEIFDLNADVASYNETNDTTKIQNNYRIGNAQFLTAGLGGKIELIGLNRQIKQKSSNLIDVKSENNWYSECFDSMKSSYTLDDSYTALFNIESKYNYGKTYNEENNSITVNMLSNQCYVYDLSDYVGETVTMSFLAKTTEQNAKIYFQSGKRIGQNIEQITGIEIDQFTKFEKNFIVPEDGYIGFYLEKYEETIIPDEDSEDGEETQEPIIQEKLYNFIVKNLKVELGEKATEYSKYGYDLCADTNVEFIDVNHITYDKDEQRCKYYVRVKSDDGRLDEHDYTYDSIGVIEESYKYPVSETTESVKYTLELVIKQYGREYILSSVEFEYDPEECTEIKSISNTEEFKEIQPYGNYILLNDIDLTQAQTTGEFTFGNPNISFYGSIDFNGKTIKKDTYSLSKDKETTSYIFYKIDEKANMKNIVIDYYLNNTKNRYTTNVEGIDTFIAEEDGIYSLFLYNDGIIDNVIVNLKSCTQKQRINVGLIGYKNSGTIDNFIVNFENILYGSQNLAGLCLYSDGTIQNGYVYGNGIEAIGNITIGGNRYISGCVFQVDGEGILQNVYNIVPIRMSHIDATYSYAANIVYNVGYPPKINESTGAIESQQDSTAIVRNVYSVYPIISIYNDYEYYGVIDSENKEENIGPNILNKYTNTTIKESYYFCDVIYDANDYNTKSSATALYEPGVQEIMLNANGFNQFIIESYVKNGYYPHLDLNYCMPKQDNIRIDVIGTEIIDILSGEIIKDNDISNIEATDKVKSEIESYINTNNVDISGDNISLTTFRVYNPAGTTISEINVQYMNSTIMSQSYSKKVSTVYCILDKPTSFLDLYEITSVRSRTATGRVKESIYGKNEELGTRTIEVTFIKNISTAEEWNDINNDDVNGVSGLIQNYRLIADIDFANSDATPYISGIFQGYLDGKYNGKIHTLKNIEGTSSVIKGFSKGVIKNLYVDGLIINTSLQKAGFIENVEVTENIEIDNIHIKNMEITSSFSGNSPYIGGIAGYINSGSASLADEIKIQNCSIQGLTIEFTNTSVTNIAVGGIEGYIYVFGGVESYVTNSFVQNLVMNVSVTSNRGVGGIVGYEGHDVDERIKPGTPYMYIENCYTIGKINTMNYAGGILGYGTYNNKDIKYCYSMVNITSKVTSGNAYIGGIVGYTESKVENISNNLYLGNIYVAGNNVKCVNRIFGGNSGTTAYRNYAYKDQLINGEISTNSLGATKLLSYNEMFQSNTYSNLLEYDSTYAYKIMNNGEEFDLLKNEYLPQLNDTEGNILSNQKLTAIDNDLKLDSITSTPSSDKTQVTVIMKFENKNDLNLTRVKIENDDMQVVDGSWQVSKDDNNLTVVTFIAKPRRAYDSYKIESIYYERNGQENEKEITTKIKVELFKAIANAQEWNEFFEGEGRVSEGQNVKITGNIDFNTVNKTESNVIVGKIEADSMKTISNVNIYSIGNNSGFIKEVKTSIKNIIFENCEITGNARYSGIISIVRGSASNCKFNNIKVSCNGDYIGIVSRNIAGSFNNITLNNIELSGKSYVGGLCGQTKSLGTSSNIEGTYVKVTASGDIVGGIFGEADGYLRNISAYQYSTDGKISSDKETSYLVKGNSKVAGCIGRYASGGSANAYGIKTTNSNIQGNSKVAGNIGEGSGSADNLISENNIITARGDNVGGNVASHGWTYSNLKSTNNIVTGNNNVGGNVGNCGYANDNTLTSENNTIKGNNYVGGCVGIASHYYSYMYNLKSKGTNQTIIGVNHIGGVIGRSVGRIKYVEAEKTEVTATGSYVGGIVGSSEYSTTSISATNNSNYALAGAEAKDVIVNASLNFVGGIVGYQVGTLSGVVLENSIVTANGKNIGGIAGFYTGYNGTSAGLIASSNFFMWHSYCSNSTIKGSSNVGGIAGNFVYGNIQYCYVGNTSIIAENDVAGGIVGYFDNTKLSNIQYKASIKYNFIANTQDGKVVSANNSVGGLIGMTAKQLNYDEDIEKYNNIECNLIVTDITSNTNYISMGIGSVAGNETGLIQSPYMNNIYTYNCSTLNGIQVGGIIEEKDCYNMLSSAELSTNIYTKNEKIINEEGQTIGNRGLNFGSSRYEYSNGYFPRLKNSHSSNLYWGSGNLNIIQNMIPIPNREVEFTENAISLNSMDLSTMNLAILLDEELPDVTVYTSDIDKINIEFRNIGKNAKFKITSEDKNIVEHSDINECVYTLQYDFATPLKITVYNMDYSYEKEIVPEEIRNILSIVDDEYLYLLNNNSINSNKRTIDGGYINLYKNKLLNLNGEIYDVMTMKKIEDGIQEIKLLENPIPIEETRYEDTKIETFAHCSKVTQNSGEYVYKEQQIFIRNGYMYAIDGKLNNKNGNVIIDSYNNKQYETILGEDGVMYDVLTEIKYPTSFKNKDILSITSNNNENGNIVLVYYENGKVIVFNYITGEELYNNNVKDENINIVSYIIDNFKVSNISYNINESDYIAATELANKLDKVPVDEAMEKINKSEIEIDVDTSNNQNNEEDTNKSENDKNASDSSQISKNNIQTSSKNTTKNKYVTTYDAGTQSYVVYSAAELIRSEAPNTQTENEKINSNKDLISYYTNLSSGLPGVKNTGITIIASIVGTIFVILIVLYKKTNR